MKIQNRIIYILLTVFICYTLLFSAFIYYSISNYAFTDFYKRLEIRAITTAKSELETPHHSNILGELRQEYLEKLQDEKIYIIKITNNQKWRSELNNFKPAFIDEAYQQGLAQYNDKKTFYYAVRYFTEDNEEYMVVISAENYFISHHIYYLRNLLFTSLAIAFLLILIISFLFSRRIIQPINDIINKVKEISLENLHLRLPAPKNERDTINDLSNTFNDMLTRLETSFETQKNFISNASHELNTPLTSIMGEAEVTLSKPREKEEYIHSLSTILLEAEKLEKKTKALLMLAQTGFDGKRQKFLRIRMDQLLLDVKETVVKIAPECKIIMDFSLLPENPYLLKIKANEPLLHLAFSNIILNGCKYSNYAPVKIGIGVADNKIIIIIKDDGIGIPAEELKFIYDPYFRASNTGEHEGYGIGLPLARNIIKLHQGEILVSSQVNKGTTVQVILPCDID